MFQARRSDGRWRTQFTFIATKVRKVQRSNDATAYASYIRKQWLIIGHPNRNLMCLKHLSGSAAITPEHHQRHYTQLHAPSLARIVDQRHTQRIISPYSSCGEELRPFRTLFRVTSTWGRGRDDIYIKKKNPDQCIIS